MGKTNLDVGWLSVKIDRQTLRELKSASILSDENLPETVERLLKQVLKSDQAVKSPREN